MYVKCVLLNHAEVQTMKCIDVGGILIGNAESSASFQENSLEFKKNLLPI